MSSVPAVRKRSCPQGYCVEHGGQFENLRRASRRLAFAVPLALLLILVLLYTALYRWFERDGLISHID